MSKNFIKEYLSDQSLDKIAQEINEIEKKTSGELRVCIKKKRGLLQIMLSPRKIAIKEFYKLKMHETSDKTGVLFLILFDEHKFEIVADEGINSKITSEEWDLISNDVKKKKKKSNYLEGILYCLDRIGEVLIKEFPIKPGDKDELSNEVMIRS